jgi:photosystem II stability/assembly factor-like uncharacterized protein
MTFLSLTYYTVNKNKERKINHTRLFIFLILAPLLLQLSCKDNGVMPPPPPKDPRTYTWTIDTLSYPAGSFQTTMRDIWASSPKDVYVVGHNSDGSGQMFHYDGQHWSPVNLFFPDSRGNAAIDLNAILGFGPTNIYAVGERTYDNPNRPPNFLDSTLIIQFNGQQWREQRVLRRNALFSISATSPNDIWTCGRNGSLFHFDGTAWNKDSVLANVPVGGEFLLWNVKASSSSEAYILGTLYQNSLARITSYFFKRSNQKWALVDSFYVEPGRFDAKFGQNGLWVSPTGTLYSFGPHIFRWTGSSWVKIFDFFDALRRMSGASDNNFFAVGDFGNILHYNGNDWYQFKELKNQNAVYSSVWTDGQELFVVGYLNDGSKTLVLHGK